MKSLGYLFFTTIKNYFKDLKNQPGKIVLYIIVLAMLGVTIYSRSMVNTLAGDFRDISEVYAMVFALYTFTFLLSCFKGFSSGASFYSMADVNMLFPRPISSKKILFYGLIKQMGTSIIVGFFLLFQYGWLGTTYNLSFSALVYILIGYGFVIFSAQITSMAIYSFTSSSDTKQNIVKGFIYALCAVVVVYIITPVINTGEVTIKVLVERIDSSVLEYVPIVGWIKGFVIGILSMDISKILIFLVITLVYIFVIILLIIKSKGDYYEDVLKATEVSFSAITAKKEGKAQDVMPKNVKLGKVGFTKGVGATTFFYKHLIESRRSRVFILDKTSLILVLFCIGYSVIVKDSGIYGVFIFTTYMQFIAMMTSGRWIRELMLPYVYMAPVSPFKKLMMLIMESIYKSFIEAIILFIPIGIILNVSIVEIICLIFARVSFGFIFIAGNFLVDRIFGTVSSKMIIMVVYFIFIIILIAPGIALGVFISIIMNIGALALVGIIIGNILVSCLVIYICKDILSYPELNNR